MEPENRNFVEKIAHSIKRSVTLKLLSIFILMLLLMIPMSFVKSLIEEREDLREQAITEVSNKWANKQYVYGPVLSIPIERTRIENGQPEKIRKVAHFLPSKIRINAKLSPKKLKRGIYEVVVYDSKLSFSGEYSNLQEHLKELEDYELLLEEAFLTINISDLRGIREKVVVDWNGRKSNVDPGSNISPIINSGVTLKNFLRDSVAGPQEFNFDLNLQGSEQLGFVPLGRETEVELTSDWQDPSFTGAFLPDERKVTSDGFTARWKILELNRNYPQFWIGDKHAPEIQKSIFGLDLLIPTNDYQKAMRSAKYALLAISLTFLTFFLVEIFNKRKVHPFQYILIGLALVLFYTLLISISEHASFKIAYLFSSILIITIISLYARAILKSNKQSLALVIILSFTYAFVYITLQVQDYALLIGSIGLTAILAFTMFITRKINWYELSSSRGTSSPELDLKN